MVFFSHLMPNVISTRAVTTSSLSDTQINSVLIVTAAVRVDRLLNQMP